MVAIATEGDEEIRKHADHVIYIPKVRDAFSAITASVPLQLLARAIAVARGCDVDQPAQSGEKRDGGVGSRTIRATLVRAPFGRPLALQGGRLWSRTRK